MKLSIFNALFVGVALIVLTGCQSAPRADQLIALPQYPATVPSYAACRSIALVNFPQAEARQLTQQFTHQGGRVWQNRRYATPQERADLGHFVELCGNFSRIIQLQNEQMAQDNLWIVAVYAPDQVQADGTIVSSPKRYFPIWHRQIQAGNASFYANSNSYFADDTENLVRNLLASPEFHAALR